MNQNEFQKYWKAMNEPETFQKGEALTKEELAETRKYIFALQDQGATSSKIIKMLQSFNPKLSNAYRAARVYWTEIKIADTKVVGEAGEELEVTKYRVILAPNPCPICIKKTNDGSKIFKNSDIEKGGYGHVPPFHPNCYCILLPED